MKRTVFQKLGDFVLGKGFYIVLFLCVATIGISGYYLVRTVSSTPRRGGTGHRQPHRGPSRQQPECGSPPYHSLCHHTHHAYCDRARGQREPGGFPPPDRGGGAGRDGPAGGGGPCSCCLHLAGKGEILSGFSLEVLAYDETMGDWRTHSGVDIAASVGTNVLAISAGTVQGVYDDDLMGTCVVVDHGDGLTSTYCNLSAKPTVSEGDTVSTGTVLGVVGETAIAESSRPSHLHLEMAQDGKAVDPVSYLPQR